MLCCGRESVALCGEVNFSNCARTHTDAVSGLLHVATGVDVHNRVGDGASDEALPTAHATARLWFLSDRWVLTTCGAEWALCVPECNRWMSNDIIRQEATYIVQQYQATAPKTVDML